MGTSSKGVVAKEWILPLVGSPCRFALDVSRVHGITQSRLLLGGLGCAHLYIPHFPQPEPNAVEDPPQRHY